MIKRIRLPEWCNGNMRWLLASRVLRSFTQAVLVIAVPLYVAKAGYSALEVGYLLSIASLGSIGMVLAVGFVSDRCGRKPVLSGIAVLSAIGAAVYAMTTAFWPLAVMAAIASVGRGGGAGSGGNWGPFYPAEQPLIAASCSDRQRNAAFAALSFVGVLAGAAGSLIAILPGVLQSHLHMDAVASFRPLFWLCAAGGLGLVFLILPIREEHRPRVSTRQRMTPQTFGFIGRLWLTNALNGMAFGVLGPFMTYWFFVRYGVGAAEIGTLYTLVNLMTAFPFLGSSLLAGRYGAVRAIVWTRVGSVGFLALMALAPTYALAAAAYVVRMMFNSVGMPIRQSFIMGMTEERSRSTVAALGNLPSQVTSTVSPTIASYLLTSVSEASPIWFATVVMGINAALFAQVFRGMKPPEEQAQPGPRTALPGRRPAGGREPGAAGPTVETLPGPTDGAPLTNALTASPPAQPAGGSPEVEAPAAP